MFYVTFDFGNYSTESATDIYYDTVYFGRIPNDADVILEVSRTDGDAWTTVPITHDTTSHRWEGSV